MGIKVQTPTAAQIEELRLKFNNFYAQSPPTVPFHQADLDRIRNADIWLQRFLEMYDLDLETSFKNLWDTCIWRQQIGANDLCESNLNAEYLNDGSVFVHSNDLDGKPLLIFCVKLHNKSKNVDDLLRIVVYWIDRTQRERHMEQLSVFFDMQGTGLATVDLDFVKRIIETFKLYYPNSLNYILVFELAWVLNAVFKVVKALLPPKAVEILKMISKKDIFQYVPKENCLAAWGGSDNYKFSFVPEQKQAAANAGEEDSNLAADKKVHFANCSPMVLDDSNKYSEPHTPSENMLAVEPSDFLRFSSQNAETTVKLTNISKIPITFKIQTTSPDKFRVRPRCGVMGPNETAEVGIWLKPEHVLSYEPKDKFLVMAMTAPTTDCSSADVAEMWKNKPTNSPDVEQHRLVCRFNEGKSPTSIEIRNSASTCDVPSKKGDASKQMDLQEQMRRLQKKVETTYRLQIITLLLLLMALAGYFVWDYVQESIGSVSGASHKSAYVCPRSK